jgi:lysophospholipase L1-like esterase
MANNSSQGEIIGMAFNKKLIYKWVFIVSIVLNLVAAAHFINKKFYDDYWRRHQFEKRKWSALFSTKTDNQEIIFIGTSLTEKFSLQASFNNKHLKNMGFGGSKAPDILTTLKRIIVRKPPKIFLEFGINDIRGNREIDTIYKDFVEICTVAQNTSPNTRLYVQSVFPTLTPAFNLKTKVYNGKVAAYCKLHNLIYIDMYDKFIVDDKLNTLATTDGIHFTPYGYYLWKKQLEPYVAD